MNFFEVVMDTFQNQGLMMVVMSSIIITLLGYMLRKRNIVNETAGKTLSAVLLTVIIPALAFNSFMAPINQESMRQGIDILIWGFVLYIILIAVTIPVFAKYKGDRKTVLRLLTIFGSTTFFGIPIISALYGAEAVLLANLFNIGYRVFLYSYCYVKMSGLKMEKKNIKDMLLNPIVIATFVGLFIWLFQDSLPQVATGTNAYGDNIYHAFLRVDQTLPVFYRFVTFLSPLASPVAWLAIGVTLAGISIKDAAKEKDAWYYSLAKIAIVPIINLVLLVILVSTGILNISNYGFAATMIMMATPAATVATAFAIGFDKEAVLASNASLLSTIVAVFSMPFWIVIIQIFQNMGIFG